MVTIGKRRAGAGGGLVGLVRALQDVLLDQDAVLLGQVGLFLEVPGGTGISAPAWR